MLERKARRVRPSYAVAWLVLAYALAGCVLSVCVLPAVTTALVHAGWKPASPSLLAGVLGPLAGWLAIAWSKLPDWAVALTAGLLLGRACPEWRWTTSAACAVGLLAGGAAVTRWCGLDVVQHYRLLLPWELAGGAAVFLGALLAPGVQACARTQRSAGQGGEQWPTSR